MKFHAGDVWADGIGELWLVFGVQKAMGEIRCVNSSGDYRTHYFNGSPMAIVGRPELNLHRLHTSLRWIRYDETMPDGPRVVTEKRVLQSCAAGIKETLCHLFADDGAWMSDGAMGINELIAEDEHTHWRYVAPPELP